ncbi:hypothetical protein FBY03_101400 [Pseudomonas sp. SJZ079]|uniref:hypothetical protein n=1 Tax=Pseudomonas sp. SJZ079 TaxID=2572887 RepID=UPI00119AFF0B|nr:hypothetical protein [Pseudomonas sp. SJZ079]TWC43204.1 hypothetical protein FBY03_101400 [Pseudomonas sp. SJZ079]
MTMSNSPIKVSYAELELAYEMVSAGQGDVECFIDPLNGAIYCVDPYGDCSDELPEDFDADACLAIPGKYELDLGKQLVFDFVLAKQLDHEHVEDMFRRKGAYSRYKDWLLDIGELDDWHAYEAQRTHAELAQWCAENGLTLVD